MFKVKKLILSFLVASYAFFSLAATPAKALTFTGPWYDQAPWQFYGQVYGDNDTEIFGERYTAAQVQWVLYSVVFIPINMLVHVFGASPKDVADALGGDLTGLFNAISPVSDANTVEPLAQNKNFLSLVFADRPLSSITYAKQKLSNFHLIPEAQAQETGFGYQGLISVQEFWVATRDMSYTIFVLITLALAFMIMFRVKLNPQTVISIQSTLPKVFIALILVTFSYAIAGFLVDLMYVAIGLISLLLTAAGGSVATTFDFLTKGIDPLGFIGAGGATGGIFGTLLYLVMIYFAVFIAYLGAGGTSIATGFIVLLLAIVFLILSIIIFFRLTLLLIRTFANILLMTIFAPLQITLGILFPDIGFGSWLKSFVANLAVFPIVGLMIMLSLSFALSTLETVGAPNSLSNVDAIPALATNLSLSSYNTFGDNGWPPFLNMGEGLMGIVFIIISFEILNMTPNVSNMIQGILSGKGPGSYGSGLTAAAGLGLGIYAGRQSRHTAEAEFASRNASADEDLARTAARRKRYQQRVENWQRNLK